ncbi:hypothetical protein B0T21DRAFT_43900 [Apiosordaria backusii]|uniref:Uncharacterized protein n=1 Tax=Apiosordaria backusii TaxID=314023 RepID=A0AA40AXI3_9PEZI|nr:hypothetical protein B0T21DRAFT_43900 [Apiosordaria backusii]
MPSPTNHEITVTATVTATVTPPALNVTDRSSKGFSDNDKIGFYVGGWLVLYVFCCFLVSGLRDKNYGGFFNAKWYLQSWFIAFGWASGLFPILGIIIGVILFIEGLKGEVKRCYSYVSRRRRKKPAAQQEVQPESENNDEFGETGARLSFGEVGEGNDIEVATRRVKTV